MPIPESAAFLAKKPTVPPTFDGVDYNDQVALKKAQDAIIREQWVRSMMARLVREEMGKCYRREGVNHLEKCGALRGEFLFVFYWFWPFLLSSALLRPWGCLHLRPRRGGDVLVTAMDGLLTKIAVRRAVHGVAQGEQGSGLHLPAAELCAGGVAGFWSGGRVFTAVEQFATS